MTYEEGLALAQSKGILFIESSAKNALNVEEAFQSTANLISDKVACGKIDLDDDVMCLLVKILGVWGKSCEPSVCGHETEK